MNITELLKQLELEFANLQMKAVIADMPLKESDHALMERAQRAEDRAAQYENTLRSIQKLTNEALSDGQTVL